jgi:hypothetical protein
MKARIPNLNIYDSNWVAIKDFLAAQLQKSREMLENPALSHEDSCVIRGKILVYKELLAAERDIQQAATRSPT